MDSRIVIREIEKTEISRLGCFLYEAIFIPDGEKKPDKEIIKLPELIKYIKDFGRETDCCLVADFRGELIGAIWTRVFSENEQGFGFVDSRTPELSMSVNINYRQQGIGRNLLKAIIDKLNHLAYEQVSLSVYKQNYAYKMYQDMGFKVVDSDEKSAKMIKRLRQ